MRTGQLPGRWLACACACAIFALMGARASRAQSSADSAGVENAKKALQQRDFLRAIELLKPVNPATPGMPTMMAVAYGMACEKEVLGHGGVAAKNPHCAQSKVFFTRLLHESATDGLALNWMGTLSYLEMTGSIEELSKQVKGVRGHYTRLQTAHPDDPEAMYWLGATAWLSAYWNNARARKAYAGDASNALGSADAPPEKVRGELARENGPIVNEGIEGLKNSSRKTARIRIRLRI